MMAKTDLLNLKARILERYDADYLVDVLNITAEELLEVFEDRLETAEFSELEDDDEEEA